MKKYIAVLMLAVLLAGCDSSADKQKLTKFEKMAMPTLESASAPASTPVDSHPNKKEHAQDNLMKFKKMDMPTNK